MAVEFNPYVYDDLKTIIDTRIFITDDCIIKQISKYCDYCGAPTKKSQQECKYCGY